MHLVTQYEETHGIEFRWCRMADGTRWHPRERDCNQASTPRHPNMKQKSRSLRPRCLHPPQNCSSFNKKAESNSPSILTISSHANYTLNNVPLAPPTQHRPPFPKPYPLDTSPTYSELGMTSRTPA